MDLISQFFQYVSATADARSPELFRKWCGIALVAGALERRVWVQTGEMQTFCNLYTLLVAPPGTGKFIIETVREMWQQTEDLVTKRPSFKVAPDSMTKASLIDRLSKSLTTKLTADGRTLKYHSLLVAAEEFSVLLPKYDMEYIGSLNSIYNNKKMHREERRFGTTEVEIEYPQINLLGGVQPSFMASVFPDEVWSTGLARRFIMVYSGERNAIDPFDVVAPPAQARQAVLDSLSKLSDLYGPVTWGPEAKAAYRKWLLDGEPPVPKHSKLTGYNTNRAQNVIKLAGISTISRHLALASIEMIDLERAWEWSFEVEAVMGDVFRAMLGRSDYAIVEELYHFCVAAYERNARKPIEARRFISFVAERTTSDKVQKIVDLAVRMNMLKCVDQHADLWRPTGRSEHGLE